jgi:LysM domain
MQGLTGDAWQTTDLAAQFGTSLHYLASANGIPDPDFIAVGQKI